MFRISGDIRVPGDKSISHRSLMLAGLATGESRIRDILPGADCRSTAAVLRTLGVSVPEIPADENKPFDMRELIDGLVDADSFLEVQKRWAKELIVGYARLDGRAIGIVANQPRQRGGVLFVDSADKAARFIWTCNAFNVPLLFLADVPGFMIGTQVERQGIIRAGAKMISAVSEATVPKLSVIVRKAYGAGLYAMAGPAFDPDACIALPGAKIAVMGPEAAINAVFYNQIQAIDDPAERGLARVDNGDGTWSYVGPSTPPRTASPAA
jgi:acetyl-CoA carboxylase carboxyltransferase component